MKRKLETIPIRKCFNKCLIGVWDNIRIDVNKINKDYRCLLICSDGLHGYVSETMIRRILESDFSLEKKVDLLIQAA